MSCSLSRAATINGITMSDLDIIAYIFCGVAILAVVYTVVVDRRARKRKAKH